MEATKDGRHRSLYGSLAAPAGPVASKDLSKMEVKHPGEVLRKGEEVRCFVKQSLGARNELWKWFMS